MIRQSPSLLLRRLRTTAFGITGPDTLDLFGLMHLVALCLVVMRLVASAVLAVDAVRWHRRSTLGWSRAIVSFDNGGLSRTLVCILRNKIQFAFVKSNPFQRRAKIQCVCVRTAQGVGGTTFGLWDVAEEDAAAFMERARPRGIRGWGRGVRSSSMPGWRRRTSRGFQLRIRS